MNKKYSDKTLLILGTLAMLGVGIFTYHEQSFKNNQQHTPMTSMTHYQKGYTASISHSLPEYSIAKHQLKFSKKQKNKMQRAASVIAMDEKTGQIVYQKNMKQPRLVASVGKLMTLYLVQQKIKSGQGTWDDLVNTDSPELRKMGNNHVTGGFAFKRNHHYTVNQLFQAALIESSNNAAIALGQWVAGNNTNFIKLMNAQAKAWHINAHFVSACGLENDDLKQFHYSLNNNSKGANYLSAKAVAVIAQHLIKEYPNTLRSSKLTSKKVDGQTLHNVNHLLPNGKFHSCVDGLKTGYTPSAGFCFVGTAKPKNKNRIITVVLHDPKNFTDTNYLMNQIYRKHLVK